MKPHQSLGALDLDQLQHLCDQCKHAIASYDKADEIGKAMQEVCDACQHVRSRLPDLVELRRTMQAFNQQLAATDKK